MKGLLLLFLVALLAFTRLAYSADPSAELWAAQGSAAPYTDPIPAPRGFIVEPKTESAKPCEELLALAAGKPFVVFAPDPLEAVRPGYVPGPCELADAVSAFASGDEYEPLTFAVYALSGVRGLKAEAGPLVLQGQPEAQIPISHMDLRAVRCLNRFMGEKKFSRVPSLLERSPARDLPAGDARQFWLNVYVSPETRPGVYEGVVRLTYDTVQEETVKVRLRVLPIKLLRAPTAYGFWYDMGPDWKGLCADTRAACQQMMKKHFVQMREYGLNSLGVMSVPESKGLYRLADIMRAGKETGLLSPDAPILYSGAQALRSVVAGMAQAPKADAAYADAARGIVQEAKAQGWPPFIFIPVDEMDNRDSLRAEAVRWLGVLKKAGVTTGATLNGLWFGQDSANSEALRGIIDVRILNYVDNQALASAQQAEKPVWLYNMGVSPWDPKRARLAFGLYTARCRAAGCLQWAYQWPAKPGVDPYHEMGSDAQFYAQSFAYPAPDGPLPTLALEAIREGIDDMRYVYTLTQIIAQARNAGRTAEAEGALSTLRSLLAQVPVSTPDLGAWCRRIPAGLMPTIRWQMAQVIMNLQERP